MELAAELLRRVREAAGDDFPKDIRLRVMRIEARIAFARGDAEAGAGLLENVIKEDPLDGDSLLRLGDHYASVGESNLAVRRFEMAANLESSAPDANVKHAQLLVSEGRYSDAIPLLQRAQELKPRDSVARFLEDLEDFVKRRGR